MSDTPRLPGPPEPLGPELVGSSIELVRAAQGGSREALSQLLERYQERVHRIARIRLGRRARSYMDSHDIVQEALLSAARHIESFELRSHASVLRWLVTLVQNQVLDAAAYTMRQKRDPERHVRLDEPARSDSDAPRARERSPASLVADAELRAVLDEEVARLDPLPREAFLQREYHQATWAEVAEVLDCSISRCQDLHRQARLRLALALKRRLDPPRT